MTNYPFHPVADLFPLLKGEEFQALVEDISANGLIEAIWLCNGKILDGRNRYRACQQAKVVPRFRTWSENGNSPVAFVISENLHRRHLSEGQRATIAVKTLPLFEQEAKERKRQATARATEVKCRLNDLNRRANLGDDAADLEAWRLSREYASEKLREQKQVYFIHAENKIKIGVSVDPDERLTHIRRAQPGALMLGYIPGDHSLEKYFHKRFAQFSLGHEWFEASDELRDEISVCIDLCRRAQNDEAIRATGEAAKQFGIGYRSVFEAKKLYALDPERFEQVRTGEKTLTEAKREVTREQIKKKIATEPTGKYRVLYADPPWKYGDSRDGLDGTTGASAHYPTMTIAELCALRGNVP